jgi:hypothetical protein
MCLSLERAFAESAGKTAIVEMIIDITSKAETKPNEPIFLTQSLRSPAPTFQEIDEIQVRK